MEKFCKDCKYCDYHDKSWLNKVLDSNLTFARCNHYGAKKSWNTIDLVTGLTEKGEIQSYCSSMRSSQRKCGPNGDWFQPK